MTHYQFRLRDSIKRSFLIFLFIITSSASLFSQSDWLEVESEHFKVLYRESHAHLVPKIINSAENSLKPLMEIFNYVPSEKIIINTYDAADFGFGAATTVPQNFIRLEIEPLENGYETVPFNDRIQWIISHELVHIVINDHASDIESFFRSIFSKVAPEPTHPITVFYSLLTNLSRYTPRWHQEAIAVFIETWFSGGYGRILGNFDEMFFRSRVYEGLEFPTHLSLDTKTSHNSFLLENSFYLYGTRFCAYLVYKYGPEKLLKWFTAEENDFFTSFVTKFEDVYNEDFDKIWDDFIANEKDFQNKNIQKLETSETTPLVGLFDEPTGWVTQPHFIESDQSVIFGYHKPHHLASIQILDLKNSVSTDILSLPTPSIQQVASTAYDDSLGLFFYTTNNNQLYRDIWVYDIAGDEKKLLFQDCRVGDITVSPVTHELWGVQHDGGRNTLVYSPYPYNVLVPVIGFDTGDDISQLSVSRDGGYLAATLHRAGGEQSVITVNSDSLKNGGSFKYHTLANEGSPESPSWSRDGNFIFFNAYVNGVSNIYRIDMRTGAAEPVTHTIRGLFKPVYLNDDSLFAFEFTSEGFTPVIVPNKNASYLPAIEYFGQKIIEQYPYLTNWAVGAVSDETFEYPLLSSEKEYSGLSNLKLQTLIPTFTGFQSQKVIGLYTHIADPLLLHDITMDIGISPFHQIESAPRFHFKLRYEFLKKYDFGVDHNGPDFYDLFNNRKRGTIGTKWRFGHTHFWVYDNPLKVKQNSEISLYTDYQYINDNLVRVSEPDFFVAQTNFNLKNSRRSIGSSDFEEGQEFNATIMVFGSDPNDPNYATELSSDFSNMTTWIVPHNVFHIKAGIGHHIKNEKLYQAKFFIGGFGNRALENVDFKQYRSLFRFPGVPIYSIPSDGFVKLMVENNFPPIRFGNMSIGQQFLNHIDYSIYTMGLITKSPHISRLVNIGAQINFVFKHWFNLESGFSAGIAKAWGNGNFNSWEWFLSYKLMRN